MTHAIDCAAVADAQSIPREMIADTFLNPGSDKARRLQRHVQVYEYDPTRAVALLQEADWRRGTDGTMRDNDGRAFAFELRSTREPQALILADLWTAIGLRAEIFITPPALARDIEFQANVKGVETSGYFISFGSWRGRVHSSAIPTPENRYAGLNRTYYENAEVDALIDRFSVALDESEREQVEGQIIERVTGDAVFYPLSIRGQASSVKKSITGLTPILDSPGLRVCESIESDLS
ncbi:MAG: hypothetical protein GEU73_04605 [Chloroflexi bacterium]|nr:hypothetical protein [Chloroflexota bacterium]